MGQGLLPINKDDKAAVIEPANQMMNLELSQGGLSKANFMLLIFLLLLKSMDVRQQTVVSQSKITAANAAAQNKFNKDLAEIKFSEIPNGANTAEINRIEEKNQQYAAMRENIQSMLITCRQSAQVEMTSMSTNVDILEQDASENSKWVGTLNTILKVIDEISKSS